MHGLLFIPWTQSNEEVLYLLQWTHTACSDIKKRLLVTIFCTLVCLCFWNVFNEQDFTHLPSQSNLASKCYALFTDHLIIAAERQQVVLWNKTVVLGIHWLACIENWGTVGYFLMDQLVLGVVWTLKERRNSQIFNAWSLSASRNKWKAQPPYFSVKTAVVHRDVQ